MSVVSRGILKSRVFQHGNPSRKSHVYQHISQCEIYLAARQAEYGIAPNDTQCREFLLAHFKSIKSNLNSHFERIAYEVCV